MNKLAYFIITGLVAGVLRTAPAEARARCEADLVATVGGRVLCGAIHWRQLGAVVRAEDATGRAHYIFRVDDGNPIIYRLARVGAGADAADGEAPGAAHANRMHLVPVDVRGRASSATLDVTTAAHVHHGHVIETWTFRRARRDVTLTFCDADALRVSFPRD